MGMIEDILKALDRMPIWKRLQETPGEVDDLRARVEALEEKLGGQWPPEICRFCGERAARLESSRGPNDKGLMTEFWKCAACNQTDKRLVRPR